MIQVIERFHKIMLAVSRDKNANCSVSELAAILNISTSACANIVKTMVELGYLRSLGPRQNYKMGDMPYYIARHGKFHQALIATARPLLEKMMLEINELAVLVVEHNGRRCELLRMESNNLLQVKSPNNLDSLMTSPTGCVILAGKTEEYRESYWKNCADKENCPQAKSFKKFNDACKKINKEERIILEPKETDYLKRMQLSARMAFPIYKNGETAAALGLVVPMIRFSADENRNKIMETASETAQKISEKLTGGADENKKN